MISDSITDGRSTAAKVARIRALADTSMSAARELNEEEFGVKHTDPRIDFAYNNALSWTIANGRPSLEVLKVEIALGRWLQRTSRKSGRQRIPLRDLMSRAQARKREIMDEYPRGHPQHRGAAKAEDMVADEFQPGSGISSKRRFIVVMRRPSKWNRK